MLLRQVAEARIYLGVLYRLDGCIIDWLEIWVQDSSLLRQSAQLVTTSASSGSAASSDSMSATGNHDISGITHRLLDARWSAMARVFATDPDMIITGWEDEGSPPLVINLAAQPTMKVLGQNSNGDLSANDHWQLCTSDAACELSGLPSYSGSLHRYLISTGQAADVTAGSDQQKIIAASPDAPTGTKGETVALESLLGQDLPFNIGAGRILVTRHAPLQIDEFSDLLMGRPRPSFVSRHSQFVLEEAALHSSSEALRNRPSSAGSTQTLGHFQVPDTHRLFVAATGSDGRKAESFHLRLIAWQQAIAQVRHRIASTQTPMLNLTAGSFAADFDTKASGLPSLWTHCVRLIDPGEAVAVDLQGTDDKQYLRLTPGKQSTYQPQTVGQSQQGICRLRYREVVTDEMNRAVIAGSFETDESMAPGPKDTLKFSVNLGGTMISLPARIERDKTNEVVSAVWSFQSLPMKLTDAQVSYLRSRLGTTIPATQFEVVPALSSPVDLYALAVLGVRLMMVGPSRELGAVMDDLLRLGSVVHEMIRGSGTDLRDGSVSSTAAPSIIAAALERQPALEEALRPQLAHGQTESLQDCYAVIPKSLWLSVLSHVLAMIPGLGTYSDCLNYGDASSQSLQLVFDPALTRLDELLVQTRSLVVMDLQSNREIHDVITTFIENR